VTNVARDPVLLFAMNRHLAKAGFLGGIVLSVLWSAAFADGQISPGPLSRAHQSINGLTDCTSCHEISPGGQSYKCLSCHTEIASRVAARRGLHARYNSQPGSSQKCVTCHSEHNGRDFTIVKFDIKAFDHAQTGYKLEGKHASLECGRCHLPEHISKQESANIKVKDLRRTYLGVSPDCTNCHRDLHKGRLGSNCLQCHNFIAFKDVTKFDHSLTRYPLSGLHSDVGCSRCHTPGRDQQPRYTGIAFHACSDCHADPHRGGFSEACASCHRTSGWKTVVRSQIDRAFDHSRTLYPLVGKHAVVECDRCHGQGDFKKPLEFNKCSSCHHQDPHRGQFDTRVGGNECSNCHTVNGFKPSTFGLKAHAATAYPLEGKHATVPCGECHIPKGGATLYKIKFKRCDDCHADVHAGQFGSAPYLNCCEQCHSLQKFMPSTFGLSRHDKTPFPLTDSHLAVPCNSCHKESRNINGKLTVQFKWGDLGCSSCHTDPHHGHFNAVTQRLEHKGIAVGCGVCHSTQTWNDLSRFDHFETAFPLNGAHAFVKCNACHKPASTASSLTNVDFKRARKECEACHEDVHGRQFADHGVTACSRCHDTKAWKPSRFDHDKETLFPLQGAHRNVRCEDCHKLKRVFSGKDVLFYKPTPRECVACHANRNFKAATN